MDNGAITILTVPVFSTLCNAAFKLRHEVFIREQNVPPEIENDDYDLTATHVVAIAGGDVVGTLRLVELPEHAKIGRVAVRSDWRRRGVARLMLEHVMTEARGRGQERFYLGAQLEALGLYEKLGFVAYGEVFTEAGILHRNMKTY
ncbi:MAG TPA: GNAT family N-acetyltransferase [Devosiaceae bacterium]|jgi:predicted GNAT family N-acyltransferase